MVRNLVVWSQGSVCSSHWNTLGMSTTSLTSMLGNTFIKSCSVCGCGWDSTSFWLSLHFSINHSIAALINDYKLCITSSCSLTYTLRKLLTNRLEANWRTRETLAIKVAWRLGLLKLNAVPTADWGSAPLPVIAKRYVYINHPILITNGRWNWCTIFRIAIENHKSFDDSLFAFIFGTFGN